MYKGYELQLSDSFLREIKSKVESHEVKNSTRAAIERLQTYVLESETIESSSIATNIFEINQYDVFLSHSYKDVEIARRLAIYLKDNFGLNVFVDSNVWGSYEDILRAVDKKYCLDRDLNTYRYHDRNRSTAHMHMILMTSLMKMIDQCETFFFLHSDQSINHFDSTDHEMTSSQKTYSPWIHSELQFSSLVQRNPPQRWGNISLESLSMDEHYRPIPILHEAPTSHLADITDEHFRLWLASRHVTSRAHALDQLYDIVK